MRVDGFFAMYADRILWLSRCWDLGFVVVALTIAQRGWWSCALFYCLVERLLPALEERPAIRIIQCSSLFCGRSLWGGQSSLFLANTNSNGRLDSLQLEFSLIRRLILGRGEVGVNDGSELDVGEGALAVDSPRSGGCVGPFHGEYELWSEVGVDRWSQGLVGLREEGKRTIAEGVAVTVAQCLIRAFRQRTL